MNHDVHRGHGLIPGHFESALAFAGRLDGDAELIERRIALGDFLSERLSGPLYHRRAALVHELLEPRDDKRLLRLQKQLAKQDLLIMDELGYVPLSKTGSELLFEVFSQRYERASTLVTSNLPFNAEFVTRRGLVKVLSDLLKRLRRFDFEKHQRLFLLFTCMMRTTSSTMMMTATSHPPQCMPPIQWCPCHMDYSCLILMLVGFLV